jgi:maltose alpha-D-glucosyltransferase/alpha-amylase
VPNRGDAWSYTLDAFGRYLERVMTRAERVPPTSDGRSLVALAADEPAEEVRELVGLYLGSAHQIGARTADMHLALAAGGPAANAKAFTPGSFTPEPFTSLYQRSVYQAMRSLAGRSLRLLRSNVGRLEGEDRAAAAVLLDRRQEVLDRFAPLLARKMEGLRLRTHGDYHLGQVLYTGRDFVILDFEGEPLRALSERRIKRSPLRDVAGMVRSLDYVAHAGIDAARRRGLVPDDQLPMAEAWGHFWYRWSAAALLRGYFERVAEAGGKFVPALTEDRRVLLDAFLLDKALYELAYELGNRPGWVRIPLRGILGLLEEREAGAATEGEA